MKKLLISLIFTVGCSSQPIDRLDGEELLIASSPYHREFAMLERAIAAWDADINLVPVAIPQKGQNFRIYFSEGECVTNAWIGVIPEITCTLLPINSSVYALTNQHPNVIVFNLNTIPNEEILLVTMVHEIGHLIKLDHSSDASDIMFPMLLKITPTNAEKKEFKSNLLSLKFNNSKDERLPMLSGR